MSSVLFNPATGQPFKLLPAQRTFLEHAFQIGPNGKLIYTEWVFSCPKKSGKSTFEAIILITAILLYGGSYPEGYILANSQEQGKSRVFEIATRIIRASPLLRDEATITADKIIFRAFDAVIQVLPCDAGSAAGSNAVVAGFDELWDYTSEAARRLWDEMMPPPTRKIAFRLTVTYAGFESESTLLLELYKRGLEQPKLGEDLYGGDGLLMFWSHKPIAPWQDEAWAKAMRRERASAYQRQFLNEFATSATSFIDMTKWDDCVDERLSPVPVDLFMKVWIGLDASVKHDMTALCVVGFDVKTKRVRLINHRTFQPTPEDPIDFEATVERTLRDWCRQYQVKQIMFDPFQLQAVAQRLIKDRLPMQEFPQTVSNLTAAGQCLYELINGGNLWVYPDPALRKAVSQTVAKETPRGWRISKQTSSHKIDLVAALSFACYACIEAQKGPNFDIWEMLRNEREPTPANPTPEQHKRLDEISFQQRKFNEYVLSAVGGPPSNGDRFHRMIDWSTMPGPMNRWR